jgi:hypothetical protein
MSIPEGRAVYNGASWDYEFDYRDIYGNLRVSFKNANGQLTKTQSSDYDALGFEFNKQLQAKTNFFKYQNQERVEDFGINIDFFKYRPSDNQTGRFWQIDPLASDYPYNSPYALQENKFGLGIELEGKELQNFLGALRAIGGAVQVAGGAALLAAPEPTGLTKVGGVIAVGHGIDDFQAGVRQLITGESTESATHTVTKSAAQAMGANEKTADKIAIGTDIGLGFVGGTGAVAKGVETIQIAKTEKALTEMAGTAKINATARTGLIEGEKGFGTAAHTDFKTLIDGSGLKNIATEQTYLGGRQITYGASGSSRADVVLLNNSGTVKRVFDFKTGSAVLSPTQATKYINNVPGISKASQIKVIR